MTPKAARIPIFRYQITLVPPQSESLVAPMLCVDAMSYREDGPWTIFDDTQGTVLSRRTETILEVYRSAEPVAHQETDQL